MVDQSINRSIARQRKPNITTVFIRWYYENRLCEKMCETSTPKKENREYKFEYIQKDDLKQIVLFKNGENYYQQMRKKIHKKMATKGV